MRTPAEVVTTKGNGYDLRPVPADAPPAEPPRRRAAEPPSRRAAEPPSRRAAEPPPAEPPSRRAAARRAAEKLSHKCFLFHFSENQRALLEI